MPFNVNNCALSQQLLTNRRAIDAKIESFTGSCCKDDEQICQKLAEFKSKMDHYKPKNYQQLLETLNNYVEAIGKQLDPKKFADPTIAAQASSLLLEIKVLTPPSTVMFSANKSIVKRPRTRTIDYPFDHENAANAPTGAPVYVSFPRAEEKDGSCEACNWGCILS